MVIDFDGIQKRVARVPVGAENYGGLSAKAGHILYGIGPAFYYGRSGDRPAVLKIYSLKDRKETTLAEDVRGYSLSLMMVPKCSSRRDLRITSTTPLPRATNKKDYLDRGLDGGSRSSGRMESDLQ